jgi:nucleotide-binding universal stress UspA family protein
MFHTIVVPLDESERAERALPVAARIARASSASLLLVRVVTISNDFPLQARGIALEPYEVVETEYDRADAYLKQMARSDELSGIQVQTIVGSHDPAEAILSISQEHQADLIVLSSHGARGATRWKHGSVAQKIVRHSPFPVLLLRSDTDGSSSFTAEGHGPLRILVPLDGSPMAEEALEPAIFLSRVFSSPAQAMLHLACVVPLSDPEMLDSTERNHVIRAAQAYLWTVERHMHWQEQCGAKISVTNSVMISPDIAQALIECAEPEKGSEAQGYGLIAMTTHGRGGLARWIMGSITERVLNATRLPMLIVHPHQQD